MYNEPYSYFAWIGTIYLIILTYQDFKRNKNIDDRYNYFMSGIAISLFSHSIAKWWFIFFIITFTILATRFLKKFNLIGEGDINAVRWVFMGFAILNVFYLAWFTFIFSIITLLYFAIFKLMIWRLSKQEGKKLDMTIQFFPVILTSFILTCSMFRIY